ncbi:MAG: GNAT family N-acetyltransferase [Phycisphaerae bacterium]
MDMKVTAYRNINDFRLQSIWKEAAASSSNVSVFCTREWCVPWAETVGGSAEPFVLVAESDRGVEGIWPLCITREDGVRWVKFMGSDRVKGDHMDFVCDANRRDAVGRAFLEFIQQQRDTFDGLLLDGIACESKTRELLGRWARQNRYREVDREVQTLPFVQLPETFDEYLSMLSHKRRSAVRRSRRKLAESGASIHLSWGKHDLYQVLGEFCRLHAKRWNAVGVKSNFANLPMRSFLTTFCTHAANEDWFRSYSLVVDGQTEGVLIAFHYKHHASFYQIGRDPESSVLNAGMMLMAASIEQAIAESMQRYDFLRGDESYKSRLAKSQSTQSTVMIGFRRPATTVIAKEQMSQRMKQIAHRVLGDERWEKLKDRMRRDPSTSATHAASTEGAGA